MTCISKKNVQKHTNLGGTLKSQNVPTIGAQNLFVSIEKILIPAFGKLFLFFRQEKIRSNIFNTGNNFYKISFLFQNILFVPIVVLVNFKLSCSLLFFIQEKSCLWRPFPPPKKSTGENFLPNLVISA